MGSAAPDRDVLYSQLLRIAHDSPRSIERVTVATGRREAVLLLRDGSRLRANYRREESRLDLEELLRRADVPYDAAA